MATCKYCGQSSGLFSFSHKECEVKHTAGVEKLRKMLVYYFLCITQAAAIRQVVLRLREESFLNADDIAIDFSKVPDGYTYSIHSFFSQQMPQVVASLMWLS